MAILTFSPRDMSFSTISNTGTKIQVLERKEKTIFLRLNQKVEEIAHFPPSMNKKKL